MAKFDGEYCLSFRIGNTRENDLVDGKVHFAALINEQTFEGQSIRRVHDLKLRRSYTPFFKLTWSIFHPIDKDSPLINFENIKNHVSAFMVTVTGHDGTFSTTIYDRKFYEVNDIVKDHYFADIMESKTDGEIKINYSKFDEIK